MTTIQGGGIPLPNKDRREQCLDQNGKKSMSASGFVRLPMRLIQALEAWFFPRCIPSQNGAELHTNTGRNLTNLPAQELTSANICSIFSHIEPYFFADLKPVLP